MKLNCITFGILVLLHTCPTWAQDISTITINSCNRHAGGELQIMYASSIRQDSFVKPLIVVDGFDPIGGNNGTNIKTLREKV